MHALVIAPQEYVNIYSTRRISTEKPLRFKGEKCGLTQERLYEVAFAKQQVLLQVGQVLSQVVSVQQTRRIQIRAEDGFNGNPGKLLTLNSNLLLPQSGR